MAKRTREGDLPFRVENSGLIDLDALMRQAESTPTIADDPPTSPPVTRSGERPIVTAPEAEKRVPAPPPPPRRSHALRSAVIGTVTALLAVGVIGAWRQRAILDAPAKARPVAAIVPRAPADEKTALGPPTKVESAPPLAAANDLPTTPSAAKPKTTNAAFVRATTPVEPAPAVLPPDAPVASEADLGGAMRAAVGAREDIARESTKGEGNARQVRPAPGAVVGAVQAALPEARACLGPDDPIRRGEIVFRSDGSVERVSLEGSRSTDACVRQALSKARVAPFLADTFATRVTVRP